jgi:hypothetical protein
VEQRESSVKAWGVGLLAFIAFLALSAIKLDRQGMYYDEVHQAPAAFYYIGEHPLLFIYPVFGIPVLNMGYSGALKSAVYGLYLRLLGAHFTVFSWRLLGLLFVAAGLLLFYRFAASRMPAASSILFLALFLTDTSVILMTRHDWGPVALSMGLRLAFIGLWISLENHPTSRKILAVGMIMGITLFEKLSAVVLLLPFLILLWSMRKRLSGVLRPGAIGFGIGSLPLILVNLASWRRGTGFISLADVQSVRTFSIQDTIQYARSYLELGQGAGVREFVLGESKSLTTVESILIVVLLSIVFFGLWRHWSNKWIRLGGYFAASYVVVGVALFLLPRPTSVYHWILATPFQYAAAACVLAGCLEKAKEVLRPGVVYRIALGLSAIALIAIRVPNLVAVESSLAAGKTSAQFHPDFNRVAALASEKSENSVFVAADWGTATQIYCGSNGKPGLVYELYWHSDPGAAAVKFMKETPKPNIYVLVTGIAQEFAAASDSILQAMAKESEWQEVPIEKEFADLQRIKVRKFVRRH